MREINEKYLDSIKCFEGYKLTVFKCPASVLTIGYGHTHTVKEGMKITKNSKLMSCLLVT
jgi:Phage-related lysozyme (muraminidase)